MSKQIFYTSSSNDKKHSRVIEQDYHFLVEYERNGRKVHESLLIKDITDISKQRNYAIEMAKQYVTMT